MRRLKLICVLSVGILFLATTNVNAQSQDTDVCISTIIFPLKHLLPTSGFGWRIHPITGQFQFHNGIDLAARHDTVFSIMNGIVTKVGNNPFLGNYILITHPDDVQSVYGHLSVIAVLPDEQVRAGQPIGITGATGRVTGEHLHFSIKYHGRELSPLAFLGGLFARPP
jgi:murein DD-endopeptidase MepM/ murein hydrolase activator NlpD